MVAPSDIQIIVKTHRTALFVQIPLAEKLPYLKADVLSALRQYEESSGALESDVPHISSEDDFELVRADSATGKYIEIDGTRTIKQQGITSWTVLYIRFKDADGNLEDVVVTEPRIDDDEDLEPSQSQSQSKGKGRA